LRESSTAARNFLLAASFSARKFGYSIDKEAILGAPLRVVILP